MCWYAKVDIRSYYTSIYYTHRTAAIHHTTPAVELLISYSMCKHFTTTPGSSQTSLHSADHRMHRDPGPNTQPTKSRGRFVKQKRVCDQYLTHNKKFGVGPPDRTKTNQHPNMCASRKVHNLQVCLLGSRTRPPQNIRTKKRVRHEKSITHKFDFGSVWPSVLDPHQYETKLVRCVLFVTLFFLVSVCVAVVRPPQGQTCQLWTFRDAHFF